MPFQVIYSSRSRIFEQVQLVTAGEDQMQICAPTVYLEAIVNGDLAGHTIEWEQISGTPVTIQQANTLTPFFDIAESTDKVFRVYIDRGTPYEQSDDVTIWQTPTSFCSFGTQDAEKSFALTLDPAPVSCEDIVSFVNVQPTTPTVPEGEDPSGILITVDVNWEHPNDLPNQPFIVQYTVVENGTPVLQLPSTIPPTAGDGIDLPTGARTYPGTTAEYRIDTLYNIKGRIFLRESCTKDFTGVTIPLARAINSTAAFGVGDTEKTFVRVDYGFVTQSAEDLLAFGVGPEERTFVQVRFSFVTQSAEDLLAFGVGPEERTINIERIDQSGIGG